MMVIGKGIFSELEGGGFFGLLDAPVPCGCGKMAMMVINRDGKTRCVECDEKYKEESTRVVSGCYDKVFQ